MTEYRPRTITRQLAQATLEWELPEAQASELLDRAATGFLDTIAVAIAATAEPARQLALRWATRTYASSGPGAAVWGCQDRLSTVGAAFVNGVAAHTLDYDDVCAATKGHPSALLVPLLAAVGEQFDRDGRSMLEAYLWGIHVTSSVAAGFNLADHYAKGWHATTTVGTIGATAAAARLAGLTVDQASHALGIAASFAAGSRANFGSMVKPLHVGVAAANAVMAIQLAGSGFEASPDVIEAPLGFLALHAAGPVNPDCILKGLHTPLDRSAGTLGTKRYPCCYQNHRAIDAMLDIKETLGRAAAADAHRITITVDPGSDCSLIHPEPADGSQARFSMPYTTATALVDGRVDLSCFTLGAVSRPGVRDLMALIDVKHRKMPPIGPAAEGHYAVVEVETTQGARHHSRVDAARGDHTRPLDREELRSKVLDCLSFGKSAIDPDRLIATTRALAASATTRDLIETVTPS